MGCLNLSWADSVIGQVIQSQSGSPFSLFASHDLSAWLQHGNANWYFDAYNREVTASQGSGYLLSRLTLNDLEISVDYWVNGNTEASLGLRCSDPNFINADNAYIVSLTNRRLDKLLAGSILDTFKTGTSPFKLGWNRLYVKMIGNLITIQLNEKNVVSNFIDNRFKMGQIAVILSSGSIKIRAINIIIPGRW